MLQAINSKRKSEGNDCTENISDQTFKKLNAYLMIEVSGKYAYCKARKSREISGDLFIEHLVLLTLSWLRSLT